METKYISPKTIGKIIANASIELRTTRFSPSFRSLTANNVRTTETKITNKTIISSPQATALLQDRRWSNSLEGITRSPFLSNGAVWGSIGIK